MAKAPTQESQSNWVFGLALAIILCLQIVAGLWHIGDPFIDGRYHYNWGPPFWLLRAEATNEIGLVNTYFTVADYSTHPHLIAPTIALWTSMAGYSEFSIRLLALLLTVIATGILACAVRLFLDTRRALLFTLVFAAFPLVYIYGKKLDQEPLVLIFLAIQLLGTALVGRSLWWLPIVFVGSLGMMLSDWSGLVLSFVLSIAAFVVWWGKELRVQAWWYAGASLGAAGLGLVVYIVQFSLQAGSATVGQTVAELQTLYKNKAGISTGSFSWLSWIRTEISFISKNFSIPLALVSLGSVVAYTARLGRDIQTKERVLAIFSCAIFLGTLIYIVAVPQTSGMHVYFHYYFAVPLAVGVVYFVDTVTARLFKGSTTSWLIVAVLLLAGIAGLAIYQYDRLLGYNTWGDKTDMALMKSLRDLPASASIVAGEEHPALQLWFQNPNIGYYAGRTIPAYVFDDGVPFADYQIVPERFVTDIVAAISTDAYGKAVDVTVVRCSTNYCLLHLEE